MMEIKQISDMKVAGIEPAYKRLLQKLVSGGYEINQIKPVNNNRYIIVTGSPQNILIIFKREPFFNFGIKFRAEGQKGVGDTININELKTAIRNGVTKIYSIFPNGVAYSISIQEFLENSFKWKQKEGKEVRSISIQQYHREFEI